MIVFDLRCAGEGHVFEAWFGSTSDYEDQRARGLVQCPICGDGEVGKAVMAPAVGARANRGEGPASPAAMKAMLRAMAKAQGEMLAGSEYVGERFANEARAIHLGEADARTIHGRATRAESEALAAEGVPVAPLPFPVPAPEEKN